MSFLKEVLCSGERMVFGAPCSTDGNELESFLWYRATILRGEMPFRALCFVEALNSQHTAV